MSKFSNLVTASIFIAFLAILFHYFCRVRKKPPMVIQQQQIQVPEGYVYPITSNVNNSQQIMVGTNFGLMHQNYPISTNTPYPVNFHNPGIHYASAYTPGNSLNSAVPQSHNPQLPPCPYPPTQLYPTATGRNCHVEEDPPPPYHTVVGGSSNIPYTQPQGS